MIIAGRSARRIANAAVVFQGAVRRYRPDFLIRLKNGTTLVLEVKGQDSDLDRTKRRALSEWVEAVNAHGGFGEWSCDVSFATSDLAEILSRHGSGRQDSSISLGP
jgi:type III restriction enzyme